MTCSRKSPKRRLFEKVKGERARKVYRNEELWDNKPTASARGDESVGSEGKRGDW